MTTGTTRAGELDLILHAIPAGITVLDQSGTLIYANDVAAAACGFRSGAEMTAAPVAGILGRFQLWDEEGRPLAPGDLHGLRAVTDHTAERTVRFRFVSPTAPDRWISIRAVPVLDREGKVSRVVNVFRDVTERRRAERWSRFLGEASTAAAASMDVLLLLQQVADQSIRCVADWCKIEMRQPDGTLRRVAEAGSESPGASSLSVPLSARGDVIGGLTLSTSGVLPTYGDADRAAAEDLARRLSVTIDNVRLYEDAQEALRAREDLLAIVSHDLRNPLGVVLASSALLLKSSLPPEKEERARRQVEAIQRAGNRMNRLIRDLLDFASIQGGRLSIARRPHDAANLVAEVVEALEPLATQKSLRVQNELGERSLSVSCDHDRVIQAFSNILGNAIKFTPEGGSIRIGAEREGAEVRFYVGDTGPGIPTDEVEHVFDRYFQARRKNRDGIGLGLSIAKGIVDAHGGRIWVDSQEGKGSTFFVALPAG